ncbi:MAG: winged helix-turn-helix transcriptional regulator [Syntrophomonas sp.]
MRLTLREKEILDFVTKHPMIAQDDLARHFGITRSSVAVHISNLMKKGAIMGKGYVVNEQVSIVVIGRIFLQINIAQSEATSAIDLQYTGFALESCKALSGLGLNLKVISVVGNDDLALTLIDEIQKREADITNIARHPEMRSGRLVKIDGTGAYEEGFSLEDYEKAINQKEWVAMNCQWLIIEPVFHQYALHKWLEKEQETLPSICTCALVKRAEQMPDFLSRFSLVVLGVEDTNQIEVCANQLAEAMGQGYVLVTDGRTRILYINDGNIAEFPLLPSQQFNLEKSLPYLLGGVVYGLSSRYNLRQAVRMAVGTASSHG